MLDDGDRQLSMLGGLGILNKDDLPELTEACRKIFHLMRDGEWHTADEIEAVAGQREALRRMRDLRKRGHKIEWMRDGDSRRFLYRMIPRKNVKGLSATEVWRRS